MKRPFTSFLTGLAVCLAIGKVTAQPSSCNLVTNGDFETANVSTLNGNLANVGSDEPNANFSAGELANWRTTTNATPDFFATLPTVAYPPYTQPSIAPFGSFTPLHNIPGATNGCLGLGNDYEFCNIQTCLHAEYAVQYMATALRGDRDYYASMQVQSANQEQCGMGIGIDITTNDPRDYSFPIYRVYSPSGCGIQSNGDVTATTWVPVTGTFHGIAGARWLNIGNFQPFPPTIVRPGATYTGAYMYIDDVEIYEVPVAGSDKTICPGTSATLGEGCPIPGATYAWKVASKLAPVFATTPKATVSPTVNQIYQLTVTVPGGKTFTTYVNVNLFTGPPVPVIVVDHDGSCQDNSQYFRIDNFDPSLSYSITASTGSMPIPGHTGTDYTVTPPTINNRYLFRIKGGLGVTGGSPFRVTATAICNGTSYSRSTSGYAIYPGCDDPERTSNAYPNPANESIRVPAGVENVILLNNQGQVVARPDATSKLNVQALPAGLYNLQMQQNGKLINQHIEVKH